MSSKSTANLSDLVVHEPITENQTVAYDSWDEGDNLVLAGSAGTGKTFVALYLALEAVLEKVLITELFLCVPLYLLEILVICQAVLKKSRHHTKLHINQWLNKLLVIPQVTID